jgi:AAA+ ATPase superfamily predicted ATPase
MNVDHQWIARELRSALKALAAPGFQALASVPDGTVKAEELALDYDNFVHAYLGNFRDKISQSQRDALLAIDAMLQGMSGQENAELWTEDAVVNHPKWESVRVLARDALAALGWNE